MKASTQPAGPNQADEADQPDQPDRRAYPGRPARQPAKQDRTTVALLLMAAFIAVGGVGFALGHLTAPSAAAAANPSGGFAGGFGGRGAFGSLAPGQTFNPGQFGGGRAGLGGSGGGISGTVQSITGSSITIQEADGSTATLALSGTTTYHSAAAASASDVRSAQALPSRSTRAPWPVRLPTQRTGPRKSDSHAKDVLITNP